MKKILNKFFVIDPDLSKLANVYLLMYRIFTYAIPTLIILWAFVIENLINKEITTWTKVGCVGLIAVAILVLIAIHFIKKTFIKKIEKITDKLIDCTDDIKKKELVSQKRKLQMWQSLFFNICFIIPFIIVLWLVALIETKMIALRGTLFTIVISMLIGFMFNYFLQKEKIKR